MSVFKNHELIESDLFHDRAFIYADGFFETMRVVDGSIPLSEYHIDRALNTATHLRIPLTKARLLEQIEYCLNIESSSLGENAIYKLLVSRGEGGRAGYPPNLGNVNVYSFLRLSVPSERSSVSLRSIDEPLSAHPRFAGLKLINRLDYSVAVSGLHFELDEEALFLDRNQKLVETMHHNIFFINDKELCTPDLSEVGVRGVARRVMIEQIAPALGLSVNQDVFSIEDLKKSEGAFLTNAVEGLVEVTIIDDLTMPRNATVIALEAAMKKVFTS